MILREEWQVLGTEAKRLYVREWLPEVEKPQALVQIVHGHGEHGERYRYAAERMTAAGFAVVAHDLQGHGRSEGKRGHMSAMDAAIDDVLRVMEDARERHTDIPVLLYGHSMGGNIALNCALRRKPDIAALILTSPWLKLAFNPPAIKEWVGKGLARIFPTLPMSTGLKPEDLFRPSELGIPPIGVDPLNHTTITPRAYLEVQSAGEWALRNGTELHVPLLLLHGDCDRITSFEASRRLASDLGERCDWNPKEGGLHELHNDIGGKETLSVIIDWIRQRLSYY